MVCLTSTCRIRSRVSMATGFFSKKSASEVMSLAMPGTLRLWKRLQGFAHTSSPGRFDTHPFAPPQAAHTSICLPAGPIRIHTMFDFMDSLGRNLVAHPGVYLRTSCGSFGSDSSSSFETHSTFTHPTQTVATHRALAPHTQGASIETILHSIGEMPHPGHMRDTLYAGFTCRHNSTVEPNLALRVEPCVVVRHQLLDRLMQDETCAL